MTFTWFGRQVDVQSLASQYYNKDSPYGLADGTLYNWNDNYHRNPYWQVYENPAPDSRDRVVAQASATYTFTPWLTRGRPAAVPIHIARRRKQISRRATSISASASYQGAFTNFSTPSGRRRTSRRSSRRVTAYRFVDFDAELGRQPAPQRLYSSGYRTSGILVPGIYNLANAGVAPTVRTPSSTPRSIRRTAPRVATVNKYWTVEVTGRNDWSSTLPKENASYFYPSVSSALVLSDLFPSHRQQQLAVVPQGARRLDARRF